VEAVALGAAHQFTCLPVVNAGGAVLGAVPMVELRAAADATVSIVMLMQTAHTIQSDAPLLRAVVKMNDLGVRQLLVVDSPTESRLVGILAMSDLVRAHAKAARASSPGHV
jgi:CBS domain-containing protein